MPERDAFPPGTEQAFDTFLNQPDVEKHYHFGHVKRAGYRHWLLHSRDFVKGQTKAERQQ